MTYEEAHYGGSCRYLCVVEWSVELVDSDAEVADHEEQRAEEDAPVPHAARAPHLVRAKSADTQK